jgi:hypothetical protein
MRSRKIRTAKRTCLRRGRPRPTCPESIVEAIAKKLERPHFVRVLGVLCAMVCKFERLMH